MSKDKRVFWWKRRIPNFRICVRAKGPISQTILPRLAEAKTFANSLSASQARPFPVRIEAVPVPSLNPFTYSSETILG
jgi:hypothetical protein